MARWASAFSGTARARHSNRRTPSGSPSYRISALRPRTIAVHWLMNATNLESHAFRPAVSNSKNFTDGSLLKASRTGSTPGIVGGSRQLPETRATTVPGDICSTIRFGMEVVVVMGLPFVSQSGRVKLASATAPPRNEFPGLAHLGVTSCYSLLRLAGDFLGWDRLNFVAGLGDP